MIIVLTGYPAMETAEQGIQLGIDEYIAKPASADHLVATLAEKLAARRRKTGAPVSENPCQETTNSSKHGRETVSPTRHASKKIVSVAILRHTLTTDAAR